MAVKFAPPMGFAGQAQVAAMTVAFAPKDADPYSAIYYGPTQARHHFLENPYYRNAEESKRIQKLTDARNELERMRAKRPHR